MNAIASLRITLLLAFAAIVALALPAKKIEGEVVTVEADFTYYQPGNLTNDQARVEAVRLAQARAIADAFGTTVSEITSQQLSLAGAETSERFEQMAMTDVNGEWIETIGSPQIQYLTSTDGQPVMQVHIKGRVRRLNYLRPRFRALILRNGTTERDQSTEFRTGDNLMVSFRSPTDGYVAIFTKDDSVRCLLPDIDARQGLYPVRGNRDYTFFTAAAERIVMECAHPNELNAMYILFSSNPIGLPVSHYIDSGGLPVYTEREFRTWLSALRSRDTDLQVETSYFVILN